MACRSIRVDPPLVEFKHVRVGWVYKADLTITNIGKGLEKINIQKPTTKLFRYFPAIRSTALAPGLSICITLEHTPQADEKAKDVLSIHVDGKETIRVPLLGFPRTCVLSMHSLVNFGCVVASSELIVKQHPIANHGSEPGTFNVKYDEEESSVRISPLRGVIAAGTTKYLRVELHTDKPGQITDEALVELQNGPTVVLTIHGEVVEERLDVVDLQGTPLYCLCFGPVYFGTSFVKTVVLRNKGPQVCDWVCLIEKKATATELGTDIQRSTDTALLETMKNSNLSTNDLSRILVCEPAQGRLGPYSKTTVAVRFTAVCSRTVESKDKHQLPGRQDYCLFLLFDSVGSKHGFTHRTARSSVEMAVTGSGLPVSLVPSPSHKFDFPICAPGNTVDVLCVLHNFCTQLPARFRFRKIVHFSAEPPAATIAPGQSQDVVLTFRGRQQGNFRARQKVYILGRASRKKDNLGEEENGFTSFHSITLLLSATCKSLGRILTEPPLHSPKSEPDLGVEGGYTSQAEEIQMKRDLRHSTCFSEGRRALVPKSQSEPSGSLVYTGIYVDSRRGVADEIYEQQRKNRLIYIKFIRQLREDRLNKIKERENRKVENKLDIGIIPCHGLELPEPQMKDKIKKKKELVESSSPPISKQNTLLGTDSRIQTITELSEITNAVPTTSQEVADCSKTLTAQELYQVVIEPLFVDYGRVCVHSEYVENVKLINFLSEFVWVQLDMDCVQLQGSAPLSFVLPPYSHSILPLVFQCNKPGSFRRSLSYTINQKHSGQLMIQAYVIRYTLELSTNQVVLHPNPSMLAAAGYRSAFTLRNPCSRPTEFSWHPIISGKDTQFSVRPSTGVVLPLRELVCEVVWRPSFSAPSEGTFDLTVHEGSSQQLRCSAKIGTTRVQLAEDRVVFGPLPLNILSVRTAVLHNTGQNHAYYKIDNPYPLQGMVLKPCEGVVPSKGQTVLQIQFNPNTPLKFDTVVTISLRNMNPLELRLVGLVEPPRIDINVSLFHFCGVYAGSQKAIPFTLTNHSSTLARVTFDPPEHRDFFMQHSQPVIKWPRIRNAVELMGHQSEQCSLVFSPSQMVSHDFPLILTVNGVKWPSCLQSAITTPSSSASSDSRKHIQPLFCTTSPENTKSIVVKASAWFPPLEISPPSLEFYVDPKSHTCPKQVIELKAASRVSVCWKFSGKNVSWRVDTSKAKGFCDVFPSFGTLGPDESIQLLVIINPAAINPETQGTKIFLPLYLGKKQEKTDHPYRKLSVAIHLEHPNVSIYPSRVLLTPVPLRTCSDTSIVLRFEGYTSGTEVSAETDEIELEDKTKLKPFSVTFPEGNIVPVQDHNEESAVVFLPCKVTFCSPVPLSLCTTITFTDHLRNRFTAEVCGMADNCLLTLWPYMATQHHNQRIVLKIGETAMEAVLQSYETPSPASGVTSSSFSFDLQSSGTYSYSDSMSDPASRFRMFSSSRISTPLLGLPLFPGTETGEGRYYHSVLVAVERWFSLFGWPTGTHPITVPYTLRRVVMKHLINYSGGRTHRVNLNKDTRSVMDMLHHLSGTRIPGIPTCPTFSIDLKKRTFEVLNQNETILIFLKAQGACLDHVRPEYLLDTEEFKHWCSKQPSDGDMVQYYSNAEYESLSKRSWTDMLLQIYRVLVLRSVCARNASELLDSNQAAGILFNNRQSIESNVYSSQELLLLSWLNMHYQNTRETFWPTADGVPSARWIVNFDMDFVDGLVLASLLVAYCPYMIKNYFSRLYSAPRNAEEINHNNVIVTHALNRLSLNINVQTSDLCNPNAVQVLMLCVHLYEVLPHCIPKETITLTGELHSTFSKQVLLKNPTSKTFRYRASLFGKDANLFYFPDGSKILIPPNSSTELTIQFRSSFLRPAEAALVLISSVSANIRCSLLVFNLCTQVTHITPTNIVNCESSCYQLKLIQVPLANIFLDQGHFRLLLVESSVNPLENGSNLDSFIQRACSESKTNDTNDTGIKGGEGEFLSAERSICLKPEQTDSLNILFLPFFPGNKYCCVLLLCPQVGDMVYLLKAVSHLPLPSSLSVRTNGNSLCKQTVLTFHCKVGEVLNEVLQISMANFAWEQALAVWGQHCMSADEHRRRTLTVTLHSSTVRTGIATQKFCKHLLWDQLYQKKEIEYDVEVSLPEYFVLPSMVTIPVKEDSDIPWDDPGEFGCLDVPLQIRGPHVGQYMCQVVLRSSFDIRLYLLEVLVAPKRAIIQLDFNSAVHRSVTQLIPVHNETQENWKTEAKVSGEGFSGPDFIYVLGGTKEYYPLTFYPTAQGLVKGKLTLHNYADGSDHIFALRGTGEPPAPEEHVLLHCPVGKTIHSQLSVPNYCQNKVKLKMATDVSILTGAPYVEIKPGQNSPYSISLFTRTRGKRSGFVSFVEERKDTDQLTEKYEVNFFLEIICVPEPPLKVIPVMCVAQSSVTIAIPVRNDEDELLVADVSFEGEELTGDPQISIPPRETVIHETTFSPSQGGKCTGGVVFYSERTGEFWYQLDLCSIPAPTFPPAYDF